MNLPLTWWQAVFLWPGMTFMDWLARNYPLIVIRYGFGFSVESYVFWSGVISAGVWVAVLLLLMASWRAMRRFRE
ncbi:MAG: hypothetical protein JJU06_09885 [Ectothiorhodospiraceae bacterium]|nr:hypothetical protein [Ectothiorhodospiraceae bacterium]MCH8506443.1 hypothetical protein [Ectothiorhodospiraceae bacterium]